MDIIMNGQAQGRVATMLLNNGFDTHSLRPWIGKDGRCYIARNDAQAGKLIATPTMNATATLRKDEWKILDDAVIAAAKERLRLIADLRGAGLTYNIPNGMGKTVLQTETMSDAGQAVISMDPARQGEADRPEFDLTNLPLPVIHSDFFFNARQIATSRNMGASIDTTMAQAAARRVSEEAEKLALGVLPTQTYGGGTIYGLTNFPSRITTVDITGPHESPWSPQIMIQQILAMREASQRKFHFGPWVLYNSMGWDRVMDDDYSDKKGDNTLRDRIRAIEGINDVRTLDFLPDYQLILVQQTTDVVRLVVGMDITTVQWEEMGGMRLNFKVMAILVPQLRADFNGNTGLVHGRA